MSTERKIKCVVWDLDNTLWNGVLSEGDDVSLRDGIMDIMKTLDERGILMSIASKNNFDDAYSKLTELGVADYFLYPQINWNPKSEGIKKISQELNLGLDSFAFVDDSPFEREEILSANENILTIDAGDIEKITGMDCMIPKFITEDTRNRRMMYIADSKRKHDQQEFTGDNTEFLKSLGMELTISPVTEHDLQRAYELTVRTHQLNSTGYTYSYDELKNFIDSKDYIFRIAQLTDKYGDYGKIGLILVENTDALRIKLLLMSCRVMSRGVGSAILIYLAKLAKKLNKPLFAEFRTTDRNRIMYITYKMMGFDELEDNDGDVLLEYMSDEEREYPDYLKVIEK